MYDAEKQLTAAIPELSAQASSPVLSELLQHHLMETRVHVNRLEKIITMQKVQPGDQPCEAMAALISEGKRSIASAGKGPMADMAIIGAAQKVEHLEISAYGTLRTLAEFLGFREATGLLDQTLDEEKLSDTKLSEVAGEILYVEINNSSNI